jgi:mRNA interferase MazF
MVARDYVPQRGDLVWLTFDPQAGHEQAGRRPALVLSPASYNGKSGLALMVPITSRAKGYPFEVPLPPDLPVAGVVLADQLRSLDWGARRAELICAAPTTVLEEVLAKAGALLGG